MLHLRLIVPAERLDTVRGYLLHTPGVAHIVELDVVSSEPEGHMLVCDVVRESANEVIEWLQDQKINRSGAITVEALETVVSDAAAAAETAAPGHASEALIWEELEARARNDSVLTTSFLVFMGIAACIAATGILVDAPVLIVGAMVIGPEYGPISALCVRLASRRGRLALTAAGTVAAALVTGSAAALVISAFFRATGLAPDGYGPGERVLTAFISHADGLNASVAVLAGVVGMLALTEARSGALIGVLVSVTTTPAAANVGVAVTYGDWTEFWGAAQQLGMNVLALVVSGVVTLAVQARVTGARVT